MPDASTPPIPRATYRLQFHAGFGFDRRRWAIAPYLARLGVSHVYASPYLKARPGSSPWLRPGRSRPAESRTGRRGRHSERWSRRFRQTGIGQILDFVPNHMGVGGSDNPWWLDVLEWGQDSIYAGWFDIDWDPDRRYLFEKLLVPFLGDQYGAVLEAGDLELRFEPDTGSLAVWAYGMHQACRSARCTTSACWATGIRSWSALAMPSPACRTGGRAWRSTPRTCRPQLAERARDSMEVRAAIERRWPGSTASRGGSRAGRGWMR